LSALTKLFVVLHVVLSLLLTAGLIVFINRVEDYRTAQVAADARLRAAEQRANLATTELQTVRSTALAQVNEAGAEADAARADAATARNESRQKDKDLAAAQAHSESLTASSASATQALQVAQETIGVLNKQVDDTRTAMDKIQRQNTDLNLALADLRNRNDVATRTLRNANEQIQSLKEEAATKRDISARGGGNAADAGAQAANDTTPPPPSDADIKGIVRAKQDIGGRQWATISVGSADGVTKGMRFNVVDRDRGDFLGFVTVESVDAQEATGPLDGPRLADIRQGNEVRTQL
jgi:hypothetical protein